MANEDDTEPELLGASVRRPDHVVYRRFPAETVALNLESGKYHGLNPTAGRMLELLEECATVSDAASRLAEEYGRPSAEIESDLCRLCSDLAERGLIEIGGPAN